MKKLPLILALLLSLVCFGNSLPVQKQEAFFSAKPALAIGGGGGGGGWAVIGSGVVKGSANGDSATTPTYNTTGATLIVIVTSSLNSTPTPTDSMGNTWTLAKKIDGGSGSSAIYYCASPTTDAAQTFTISGVNDFPVIAVYAFSGGAGGILDKSSSAIGSASTIQAGSITPTANNELVISAISWFQNSTSATINSGFATPILGGRVIGQCIGGGASFLIQTIAAAVNPTWTMGGSPDDNASTMASFK